MRRHQVPKENRNIAKFIVQERTQIQNGIINCSLKPNKTFQTKAKANQTTTKHNYESRFVSSYKMLSEIHPWVELRDFIYILKIPVFTASDEQAVEKFAEK